MIFLRTVGLLFWVLISVHCFGQTWARVGTGTNGSVYTLLEFEDGIAIGGNFSQVNAFERVAHCFARENIVDEYSFFAPYSEKFGTNANGGATVHPTIFSNAIFGNKLHVAGQFNHPDFESNVGIGYFEYDAIDFSTTFHAYSHQPADSQSVRCMVNFEDKLYFGGDFRQLGPANYVGFISSPDETNPTIADAGGTLNGPVHTLTVHNDMLFCGGSFAASDSDTVYQSHVAIWNGSDWSKVGNGLNGPVYALYSFNGLLYAGGAFSSSDSTEVLGVAAWDGTDWKAVGTGFTDSADTVFSLYAYDDTLYAGGRFDSAGKVYTQNFAKFDGVEWRSIGEGINGPVYDMEAYRGRLYIGGNFTKGDRLVSRNIVTFNNGNVPYSIDSPEPDQSIQIFPNPVSDVLHIQSNTPIQELRLHDALGKNTQIRWTNNQINVRNVSDGLYVLSIVDTNGKQWHEKIIIKH